MTPEEVRKEVERCAAVLFSVNCPAYVNADYIYEKEEYNFSCGDVLGKSVLLAHAKENVEVAQVSEDPIEAFGLVCSAWTVLYETKHCKITDLPACLRARSKKIHAAE